MAFVTFSCASCKQMLKAGADKAGKRVKCGKCGAIMTVPSEEGAGQIKPPPPVVTPAPPPPRRPEPPPVVEADVDFEAGPPARRRPRADEDDYDERRRRERRPPREMEEDWDEGPRRGRERYEEVEDDRFRKAAGRARTSGVVTLVGVLNLLYAAGIFVIAVGIMVAGPTLLGMATGAAEKMLEHDIVPNNDPKLKKELEVGKKAAKEGLQTIFAMGTFLFVVAGGCFGIIGGVPLLLAGIGVLRRRQWGRVLTLILGALYVLGAISFVYEYYPLNRYGWMWVGANIAYGVIVFVILLIPKFAEDFD